MQYKGKLYGHIGNRRYFDTGKTSDDWDALEKRVAELEAENKALRQPPVMFSLPSHAHLTKKALEVHGDDESELNMAKHRAWIEGGVWMLDECIKYLEGNRT